MMRGLGRLGDIANLTDDNEYTMSKRLRPGYLMAVLTLLLQVLHKDCIQLTLVSDGGAEVHMW